jgi:hypothetical protein
MYCGVLLRLNVGGLIARSFLSPLLFDFVDLDEEVCFEGFSPGERGGEVILAEEWVRTGGGRC